MQQGPLKSWYMSIQLPNVNTRRPFGEPCFLHLKHATEMVAQGSCDTMVPTEMTVTLILCAMGTPNFQSLVACDYELLWLFHAICQASLLPLWQDVLLDRTSFQACQHNADTNVSY
jgi:hypothetical protein